MKSNNYAVISKPYYDMREPCMAEGQVISYHRFHEHAVRCAEKLQREHKQAHPGCFKRLEVIRVTTTLDEGATARGIFMGDDRQLEDRA